MSKIIIGLYVLSTSLGLVLMKLGSKSGLPILLAENKIHFNLNPSAITGLLCYGLSFFLYIYLISKYDLGYIVPILAALVYLLVFSASFLVFKEVFTIPKIIGIFFIVLGLFFLNVGQK